MRLNSAEAPSRKAKKKVSVLAASLLRDAADTLADAAGRRSGRTTRDLIGLLVSHGARAWRASQPVSLSRIQVSGPHGALAVRINFDAARNGR